ncbi:hypothetical protein Bca4012_101666 [Brassica carinata]
MILLPAPPIISFPANPTLPLSSPPYWTRRIDNSAVVSAASREVDSFTSKSGYLFNLSADEADSLSEYNFPRIDAMYKKKPLILLRRLAQIGTTFGFWFGLRLADEALDRSEQMFKAYVKIAQAVSSRPDLIPPIYLDELSLLQDQITPFSTEVAFNMIEDELGLPIDELFSEISPEPVAAASLGQVYQARLRRSGEVVAVKVQRPGVRAAIALDTLILRYLAGLIKKAGRFNSDLQGQKLAEVNDLYLVEVGVYCSFNQLLEYGFYHADPHPGNFLRTYDGQLAYLDFGMMGDFRPELRDGFMEACLHLVNRDFKSLAKDFVTLGLAVLEGIAIGINPNYKVLGSTYPWIARKILTDSSPQLKSSLQSLLYESLRTETALVQKPVEGTDSKIVMKQILAFTFTEQGLDAFGLATLDSFTSVASTSIMPFSGSRPFNSLTEEDMTNLITFYRLISLFSGRRGSETQVQAVSKYGEGRLTPLDEASLVMNQLPSAEEMLPILSILPELPQESQQRLLQLPGDLVGRLVSRAFARTIQLHLYNYLKCLRGIIKRVMVWEGYVSDETMGTIAPIIVYWVYAGVNQFISPSLDKYRLHSLDEEHEKNVIPIITVVKGITSYVEETSRPTVQPSVPIQILQILIAMFIFDTCQYIVHRYMHHNKFLYRHVHSHHHRLVVPNAVGALYNHPVEVISDMLGGAAAFFASGMTPRTSVWFFCLVTVKTVDDHCGLRIPGNLFHVLFKNNGAYHDIHHQVNGVKYNYSQPFFTFWDRVMGTYMPYHVMKRPRGGFDVRMMKKRMVVWEEYVSDETMGTIAPIIVYWIYAGVNQFLSPSLDKYRLHTLDEEHEKNVIPITTVVKGITSYTEETSRPTVQPSVPIQILQILIAMFIFDTCQYFVHRYMHHNKFLYRHVHSHHHRLVVPYAVGALYNHPVEVVSDMLGGAAAFFGSGMTPRTSVWLFCLITVKAVDDHSGLRLPGNLFHVLFKNNGAYHDVHHQVNGVKYNYSQPFFTFWDRVMGTHMPYNVMKRPGGGLEVRMMKKRS